MLFFLVKIKFQVLKKNYFDPMLAKKITKEEN